MVSDSSVRTGSSFPFDVRHKAIITYKRESPGDFKDLEENITKRLKAAVATAAATETLASMTASEATSASGLSPHEMAAIQIVMEKQISSEAVAAGFIENTMVNAGFSEMAVALSLRQLVKKGLLNFRVESDYERSYNLYFVTTSGEDWLVENQHLFQLRKPPNSREPARSSPKADSEVSDNDVPF